MFFGAQTSPEHVRANDALFSNFLAQTLHVKRARSLSTLEARGLVSYIGADVEYNLNGMITAHELRARLWCPQHLALGRVGVVGSSYESSLSPTRYHCENMPGAIPRPLCPMSPEDIFAHNIYRGLVTHPKVVAAVEQMNRGAFDLLRDVAYTASLVLQPVGRML